MGKPSLDVDQPVVLFDGVCNLCNSTVQWLLDRDTDGVLRFASLQSPPGHALLERCSYADDPLAGLVVVDSTGCYQKSGAVLRIAYHLGWPYRAVYPTRIMPGRVRDWLYDVVATRRYEWFGTRDACLMPTPERRERFLDDGMYPPAE